MKLKYLLTLLTFISLNIFSFSQDLSINETLKYLSENFSENFSVDSNGNIYNSRFKFNANDVGMSTHMSSAVIVMCSTGYSPGDFIIPAAPNCIKCLKHDCQNLNYSKLSNIDKFYINVNSSYDQKRLFNALNHLIKEVQKKYSRNSKDPFAK